MKMKFIPVAKPTVGKKEADLVYKQIKSGWFSMGKKVLEFEKKVSKYLNVKYAVAMNNGTSALDSLLTALEIGPNDEVIVPSLTYISTANVVSYKRAKLVLCDSDEKTFNVDHKSLLKKITKKTKLIIVTDMKGMPIDYDFFVKLSKKTKINIIADSAESFGAKYKKKFVGSQLLAHTFSFFANKNITTGEGGMVVTNNKILKNKLKIIRNQGQNKRYNHIVLGNNYRMTDINASIGIEQLKKLKKTIIEKERVSKKYNKIFMNVKEVKTPYIPSYVSQHSWYNYTIKVPSNIRDSLVKFLYKKNVETRLSFPPVHIQPYYKKKYKYKNNSFKKSFKTYSEFIDLPIWANLNQKQILYIGNIIINFLKKK